MNTPNVNSINRIVIAGAGFEAWLSAATLLRNLGCSDTQITVCPVAGSDELDPLYSLIPDIDNDVLKSLGITNLDLVKTCRTSFSMGTRYTGLSATDFDQFRPYGGVGVDFLGGAFVNHWLRDSGNTGQPLTASDYFSYSTASDAARRNAFAPPVKETAIGPLQHQIARHVDISLLTQLIRSRALANGAIESDSGLRSVERLATSSRIEQLVLNNGEVLQADLYVDCSGSQQALIAGVDASKWVSAPLSRNYQIRLKTETDDVSPPPFNLISALTSGWQVSIPGYGWKVIVDLVVSSSIQAFQPGYLSKPWVENCVALGVTASKILPFEAFQSKFLMMGLNRLLKLLPGADNAATETVEFNHLCTQDAQEIAELSALYEIARQQCSLEPTKLDNMDIPASLKRRLALFSKRGWVAPLDTDTVERSDWISAFILLGLFPAMHDPVVDRLPADKLRQSLQELKFRIKKVAAQFPPHGAYLDALKASPERKGQS